MTDPHPLAPLTPRQREVVLLRLAGLSNRQVARKLDCTESNVKQLVYHASWEFRCDDDGYDCWLIKLAREVGAFEALHRSGERGIEVNRG